MPDPWLNYRINCFRKLERPCGLDFGGHNRPIRILSGITLIHCSSIWSFVFGSSTWSCSFGLALSMCKGFCDLIRFANLGRLVSSTLAVAMVPSCKEAVTVLAVPPWTPWTVKLGVLSTSYHTTEWKLLDKTFWTNLVESDVASIYWHRSEKYIVNKILTDSFVCFI